MIGRVVRLQVQRSPLKPGVAPRRWYDPTPILAVAALRVDLVGAYGCVGAKEVLDVHHPDHPLTRNRRRRNGISLLSTADYTELRRRFGDRLPDGVAGESVLVDSPTPSAELVGQAVAFSDDAGEQVRLVDLVPAPPCVEFARFCLGRGDPGVDPEVLEALDWLGNGRRGVYAVPSVLGTLRVGAAARITGGSTAGRRGSAHQAE